MKQKIILMALVALLAGIFSSCNKDGALGNYPTLYVVNGSSYSANIYCDNLLVATAGAHNNSGRIDLTNTSINLPVYVEAYYYNSKGEYVGKHIAWESFYFKWNKSYKITLNDSGGRIEEL